VNVLNESLYNRLLELFGSVKVAKQGQQATYTIQLVDGLPVGRVIEDGENYRVCCPFCDDTRYRLWISYLYDASIQTPHGIVHFSPYGLAWCFNEEACLSETENKRNLYLEIRRGGPPVLLDVKPGRKAPAGPVCYPQNLISIADLPPIHIAVQYLEHRGFDIRELAEHGICFCPLDERIPLASGRIIIPIHDPDGKLIGAQCRLPYEPSDFQLKYYTLEGSRLTSTLYNYAWAKDQPYVVLTEGVFDALKVGDCGVAVFGCRISAKQHALIESTWAGKPVLFAFDSDLADRNPRALASLMRMQTVLRRNHPVGIVRIPSGHDPGDLQREELGKLIEDALEEAKLAI